MSPVDLDLSGVPLPLKSCLKPWFAVIEMTFDLRGSLLSDFVRSEARVEVAALRRWIVLTPSLAGAIEDALIASMSLAMALDRETCLEPARRGALGALAVLVEQLRWARPNKAAQDFGLLWWTSDVA
ncbi:hypothetical protein OPKNFCMD_6146 [Methylobacterium crusticola]|uniref:Uncharacterized protein n=1 Tax=Methylobacterium crusticola TaxID=1697972 RepID=A0ABQ4R6Q8_9HYPH|nr:hypothetical protein [Methylobacterium crusticola]GJD53371.1 hypothetical protein OPKNFCMD_6146 [Methylobacterium crusticola]